MRACQAPRGPALVGNVRSGITLRPDWVQTSDRAPVRCGDGGAHAQLVVVPIGCRPDDRVPGLAAMSGILTGIASWWPWLAGAAAVGLVVAVLARRRIRFYIRVARALARDRRLPRWLRWLIGIGLAAKALPVDFGVDEVALGLAAAVLATRYRAVVRAVVAEQRVGAPQAVAPSRDDGGPDPRPALVRPRSVSYRRPRPAAD